MHHTRRRICALCIWMVVQLACDGYRAHSSRCSADTRRIAQWAQTTVSRLLAHGSRHIQAYEQRAHCGQVVNIIIIIILGDYFRRIRHSHSQCSFVFARHREYASENSRNM